MPTLLQKAKAIRTSVRNNHFNAEEVELAAAWIQGQVSLNQARNVLGKKDSSAALYRMVGALRWGINEGHAKIIV